MKFLYLILLLLASCATKPVKQERTLSGDLFKFCFIGDMGMNNEVQAKVAEALRAEKCHSIHMLGDLIYPSGIDSVNDPGLQEKFLKYYLPLTEEGHNPNLNLILGNHDYQGSAEAWKDVAQRYPRINFPNPYYLQNWSGLCIFHLDSNYYKKLKNYFKGSAQADWMVSLEKEKCIKKIALTHHPFKSRGPKHGNAKGKLKQFFKSQIIGKFDYLISGHEHVLSDEGEEKNTKLLISGAGGNFTKGETVGFLVFEVSIKKEKIKKISPHFRHVIF